MPERKKPIKRKKPSKKPIKTLYIDWHKSAPTSTESIPANRLAEVIRLAKVYYEDDDACTILTQELSLGLLSIFTHQFDPKQDLILIPFAAKHIITLHFLVGQTVSVTTFNGDLEELVHNNISLFNIESKYNIAEVAAGVSFYSMHININFDMVRAVVNKHPQLSVLLEDKVLKAKGRINKEVYLMTEISYACLKNIVMCKFVDQPAIDYLYRQALNLLISFANRYHAKEESCMMPDQEDEGIVRACYGFLKSKSSKVLSTSLLAQKYKIPARRLNAGFLAIFGMNVSCYQLMMQMNVAYKSLSIGCKLEEVAKSAGYRSVKSFKEAFNAYFNTNVELIHVVQ